MGRLYDAYVQVGPRFTGFGEIKREGDKAGKEYGKALAEAAAKAAQANVRRLGEALGKARAAEADAAGKVRVAESRLAEVRANSKAKASKLAAAEEAVAAAQRKAAAASDTAKNASEALDKARDRVAKTSDAAGRASGGRFTSAFKGALSKIGGEKEGRAVATRFGVGINGAMGSIISRSAGVFAAGFAAVKGAQVFGGFIKDAAESERIARITANAIRATGGAAKISAGQVSALATAISNKTAIDDEQVQTAANMLLTFKNIRNETGKGNDIFNQATQAAADLSVQFGGMDGASKQLGKALNDPIKGTTALSKAGVTFTEQQKKQIKTLVDSGNTLEAQKIILKEIQSQVGGAAAAAADPMARLRVIAGNLGEDIGGLLLPSVNRFANFVSNQAIPGLHAMAAAFQEGDVTSDGFIGVMERIGVTARGVFGFFKAEVLPRLKEFGGFVVNTAAPAVAGFAAALATTLGPPLKDVFGFFRAEILPRLQEFAGFLTSTVLPTLGGLAQKLAEDKDILIPLIGAIAGGIVVFKTITTVIKAWAIAQGILNVVLTANPIGLVIAGLAALAAGLIIAYKKSETFRTIVNGAFTVIRTVVTAWWNYYLKPIFTAFKLGLEGVWRQAQTFGRIVSAAFNAIKEPARVAVAFVVGQFLGFVENILNGAAKAFGWVPELGGKLKTAATEFGKFRDSVNAKLDGINDEPVDIKVGLAYTQALGARTKQMKFARGGIFPGYTPGRDIGSVGVSGGEAIMRPEWTRAVGAGYVDSANAAARTGGVSGVRRFLGGFASGGVIPRVFTPSGGRLSALTATVAGAVDQVSTRVAQAIAKQLVAGRVNPGLGGALGFARSQAGKPYVWGGVGPGGYDCSGFMSALTNVILGRSPHRRLFATGSFPTSMFAPGMGAFSIGSFRGNPGHMAGTLNGVPVESRGGRGVVVGSGARGANHSLFGGNVWHLKGFARGGIVGDAPFDLLDPRGRAFAGKDFLRQMGIRTFDGGGQWRSGTLGVNLSGKTETVRTAEQERALTRPITIPIYIGDEVVRVVRGEIGSDGEFAATRGRMR